ncbi:hypothetical protein [Salinarimonas soli]|nr:hypothetical protein [Salinarimonas soli]
MAKLIYSAALIMAGLDLSMFRGAIMAEVSDEWAALVRMLWNLIQR